MPAMDFDSDSSGLSSASEEEVKKLAPIFQKAKKATKLVAPPPVVSPPRPKRPPSPPHEEVLADNPDIATLVMFRSRFSEAFSSKLSHFGPQDIENGVEGAVPSPQVESLLCALLVLVLNRKKPIERGHHTRALEEAMLAHKSQWPLKWKSQNPLHGGNDFNNMSPAQRLNLLRTLVMWALTSSEAISNIIKARYKQVRHGDDENQPLSVQPWGFDGDKRRYFLVQGQDDSTFRVYREGSRYTKNAHWYSVAGDIEEIKKLAEKLDKVDGSQAARRLSVKMIAAVPMFEATEEKRRRKEYRQQRRKIFERPEPGFGIYEGRTRGKRQRYNYEEEDAFDSDDTSNRRSTRQPSTRSTPFESGPTTTSSGRQSKRPRQGAYGESLLSGNVMSTDELAPEFHDSGMAAGSGSGESDPVRTGARATRSGGRQATNGGFNPRKRKHIDGYNDIDNMSDEDEASASDGGWDSEKNEADEHMPDSEIEASGLSDFDDEEEKDNGPSPSLIVKLKLPNRTGIAAKETPPTSPPSPGEAVEREVKRQKLSPSVETNGVHDTAAVAGAPKMVHDLAPVINGFADYNTPSAVEVIKREELPATPAPASSSTPDPKFTNAMAPPAQSQAGAGAASTINGNPHPTPSSGVPS